MYRAKCSEICSKSVNTVTLHGLANKSATARSDYLHPCRRRRRLLLAAFCFCRQNLRRRRDHHHHHHHHVPKLRHFFLAFI